MVWDGVGSVRSDIRARGIEFNRETCFRCVVQCLSKQRGIKACFYTGAANHGCLSNGYALYVNAGTLFPAWCDNELA